MTKQFRDFESAREFVRKLNLKSQQEWKDYYKSGKRPDDIPSNPNGTYKNEWISMGDWIGTGSIAPQLIQFRSFQEAREFARALNLKGQKEWREFARSEDRPDDIPGSPEGTYKKDWKGFGDWLGTGNIAAQDKVFRSFEKAREFTRSLNLKSETEWVKYCKSGDKPQDIPSSPKNNYKKDYRGWGDFLGTGNIANQNREFRTFQEAREFVRKLNLKSQKEWKEYCKSGDKPDDIPSNPWEVYTEWKKK